MSLVAMPRRQVLPVTSLLAGVAIVCVLAGIYVGGYFWLGQRVEVYVTTSGPVVYSVNSMPGAKPAIVRQFRIHWLIQIYYPLARLESAARGKEVMLFGVSR